MTPTRSPQKQRAKQLMGATYSTNDEVALEFKSLSVSVTGLVTPDLLDSWRDQAFNFINARVGTKYVTPVNSGTSPQAFSILKQIELGILKERVREKIKIQTGAANLSQAERDPLSGKVAREQLLEIQRGTLPLPDAETLSSSEGLSSFNSDNGIKNTFKKGTDQW